MRVIGLALHCPRRADSARLAHVCWSGSSGGHHPSPDDRPTSCSTRRPISLGGLRYGRQFHCRPSLRRPGLSMPRLIPSLGTRSPPSTSYLAQLCPTRTARSGSAAIEVLGELLVTAVTLHGGCCMPRLGERGISLTDPGCGHYLDRREFGLDVESACGRWGGESPSSTECREITRKEHVAGS